MNLYRSLLSMTLAFFVVAFGVLLLLGGLLTKAHHDSQQEALVQYQLMDQGEELSRVLRHYRHDVQLLARVCKLVFAGDQVSPRRDQIEEIFRDFARTHTEFVSLRLIDHTGQEWLRLNHFEGEASFVDKATLQNKSNNPDVQAALTLQGNEVYYSPLELNRDYGQVVLPKTHVIRLFAPIPFGEEGKRFVVAVSLRVQTILDDVTGSTPVYLVGEQGNTVPNMASHHQFDTEGHRMSEKKLDLEWNTLKEREGAFTNSAGEHFFYSRVDFSLADQQHFLMLVYPQMEGDASAPDFSFMFSPLLMCGLLLAAVYLLLLLLFHRRMQPAIELQGLIHRLPQEYATIDWQKEQQGKEGFRCFASLVKLGEHLREREQCLAQCEGLQEHIRKLEYFATQRELRMTELKNEVNEHCLQRFGKKKYRDGDEAAELIRTQEIHGASRS